MKFTHRLGIIGGSGSIAAALFYTRLLSKAREKFNLVDDNDFPEIVLFNKAIPHLDERGIRLAKVPEIKTAISEVVTSLKALDIDILLLCCNSLQGFCPELQKNNFHLKIVNMVKATIIKLVQDKRKKVAVFCSESSRQNGVFSNELKKFGIDEVRLTDEEQQEITNLIHKAMKGEQTMWPFKITHLISSLSKRGADTILVGCTELSMLTGMFPSNDVSIIDTADVTIDYLLNIL